MAPLPTSLRFISTLEVGVSQGTRDWCQTAVVPMPKSSQRAWCGSGRYRAGTAPAPLDRGWAKGVLGTGSPGCRAESCLHHREGLMLVYF